VWVYRCPAGGRYRYPAGTWLNFKDSRLDVSIKTPTLRSLPWSKAARCRQVKDMISPIS